MKTTLPPSPTIRSQALVREAQTLTIAPADGAFGRRKHSRGMYGFWNPELARKRPRRPALEAMAHNLPESPVPHGQFIGFHLVKKGSV